MYFLVCFGFTSFLTPQAISQRCLLVAESQIPYFSVDILT